MNSISLFINISLLLCGLSLFLFGMQHGEKYLRKIGGNDLKRILAIITRNRISAYFAGLIMTLTTQSSSATTVMLIGLVSSGFMTIGQSLGMILGSDLGTTITVQLFAIKFQKFSPLFISVGFFISAFAKSSVAKGYGKLILSLGLIFFGMQIMADSVVPLQKHQFVNAFFYKSLAVPFLGLIAGTVITAIIQSSAATLAIIISMMAVFQGGAQTSFSPDLFPIIMGANLGTCSTAFLSMFGTNTNGIRVAWAHFLFKFTGVIILFPLNYFFTFSNMLPSMAMPMKIAVLHILFNLSISVLFLPITPFFEKLLIRIVPDKQRKKEYYLEFIESSDPSIPSIALSQSLKEILRMAESVTHMLDMSYTLLEKYSIAIKESITKKEDFVDYLRVNIINFLVRINREELEPVQAKKSYELVMITTDLENMADIIDSRIVKLAEKIEFGALPLSMDGKKELLQFYLQTVNRFKEVSAVLVLGDTATARSIYEYSIATGATYMQLFERHLERLYKKTPESLQTTSIHIDLLEEIRRINHYTSRIAEHTMRMGSANTAEALDIKPAIV